jgi:hypothetical protein
LGTMQFTHNCFSSPTYGFDCSSGSELILSSGYACYWARPPGSDSRRHARACFLCKPLQQTAPRHLLLRQCVCGGLLPSTRGEVDGFRKRRDGGSRMNTRRAAGAGRGTSRRCCVSLELGKAFSFDAKKFGRRQIAVNAVGCRGPVNEVGAAFEGDVGAVCSGQDDQGFVRWEGKRG